MNHQSLPGPLQWEFWRTYRNFEPTWFYATLGLVSLMLFCLLAGAIDERVINGISIWDKPFKFALSFAVYFPTLLIFARYLPDGYLQTGTGRRVAVSISLIVALEMAYITIQAALGEASHFNYSTRFHTTMYQMMGIGALWTVAAPLLFAWVIALKNAKTDPIVVSIVIGLGLTFALGGGFGVYLGAQTSHWVNAAATDANGIWLFNWATDGGDLRVAHFFGLHAMQAVPLFALLLPQQLRKNIACILVVTFSVIYASYSLHTFFHATHGQPFYN